MSKGPNRATTPAAQVAQPVSFPMAHRTTCSCVGTPISSGGTLARCINKGLTTRRSLEKLDQGSKIMVAISVSPDFVLADYGAIATLGGPDHGGGL